MKIKILNDGGYTRSMSGVNFPVEVTASSMGGNLVSVSVRELHKVGGFLDWSELDEEFNFLIGMDCEL